MSRGFGRWVRRCWIDGSLHHRAGGRGVWQARDGCTTWSDAGYDMHQPEPREREDEMGRYDPCDPPSAQSLHRAASYHPVRIFLKTSRVYYT